MKIKKATHIYTLTIPSEGVHNNKGFFDATATETLYFQSLEDAQLFQAAYYPHLRLDKESLLAVQDTDRQGAERFVLIKKVENMYYSDHNQKRGTGRTYSQEYAVTPELEAIINRNPDSVFVVRESKREEEGYDGAFGYELRKLTIIYTGSDVVDNASLFLYVSGEERWFVERGREVKITSALELKVQNEFQANQVKIQELLAEQDRLARMQTQFAPRK